MMFSYSNDIIKSIFNLIKVIKTDTFSEEEFKTIYDHHCNSHEEFSDVFVNHRAVLDVLYSLDIIGWIEKAAPWRKNIHWHYREVKAIDETYQLPWGRFDCATDAHLIIHRGACKHIVGVAKK